MENLTNEQLLKLIKIRPLALRECSMCKVKLHFFINSSLGNQLYFDSNCDCVGYTTESQPNDNSKLDFYLEQEGWQKHFKEFYKDEIEKGLHLKEV